MYLVQVTLKGIPYAGNQLAREISKPSEVGVAKHLLRYLVGTVNFSIPYKQGGFRINACSDADRRNRPDNDK